MGSPSGWISPPPSITADGATRFSAEVVEQAVDPADRLEAETLEIGRDIRPAETVSAGVPPHHRVPPGPHERPVDPAAAHVGAGVAACEKRVRTEDYRCTTDHFVVDERNERAEGDPLQLKLPQAPLLDLESSTVLAPVRRNVKPTRALA